MNKKLLITLLFVAFIAILVVYAVLRDSNQADQPGTGNPNNNNSAVTENSSSNDAVGNENSGNNDAVVTEIPGSDNSVVDINGVQYEIVEPEDTEVTFYSSESERNRELEMAIKKEIDFPGKEDVESTRYYYNYLDLNEDGMSEVFVILVGPFTSESGRNTALLFTLTEDGYRLLQKFTVASNPIMISKQMTNGWHDIILNMTGSEEQPGRKLMQYDGNAYPDPSDATIMADDEHVGGTAIIADDFASDLEYGRGLYLTYE